MGYKKLKQWATFRLVKKQNTVIPKNVPFWHLCASIVDNKLNFL